MNETLKLCGLEACFKRKQMLHNLDQAFEQDYNEIRKYATTLKNEQEIYEAYSQVGRKMDQLQVIDRLIEVNEQRLKLFINISIL